MHEVKSSIEVEVKIPVDEKIICRLEKFLGKAEWVRQENIIYKNENGFVRFRREGDKTILTLKGKSLSGKYNTRPEIECEIPQGFFSAVSDFKSSGAVYYTKLRASYSLRDCTICLDKLEEKYFVEIEGEEKDITQNIEFLGLEGFPVEKRSYTELFGRSK